MTSDTSTLTTEKLSPELKAKWIEALRSGDYAQGTGELCVLSGDDEYEHCCLGVLAEVAGIERERIRGKCHLSDIGNTLLGEFDSDDGVEYSTKFPDTYTTIQRKLAGMNDTGKTFPEIAKWIEANL